MKTDSILNEVNNYKEFLKVEEINKSLRTFSTRKEAKLIKLGKSNKGLPILCIKTGSGEKNVVIFGFPHPNEPIGSLTCISLIKTLLKHGELREKYTWYIIPCADPDGAKLNEDWFKGRFAIKKYAYNFYRSKGAVQTDWAFPVIYKGYKFNKPPSNVKALVKLMKKVRPDFVYPLHNSGFGGAYFFVSWPMQSEFYNEIINLCKSLSIPLYLGEPEVDFMKKLRKPIYREFSIQNYYDYIVSCGKDPKKSLEIGTDSIGYARRLNPKVFGLIGEIPYIFDPRISDSSKTTRTIKQNCLEALKIRSDTLDFVENVINSRGIKKRSIFYSLLRDVVKRGKIDIELEKSDLGKKKYKNYSTVAQEFSELVLTRFYISLTLGELRRLLLESMQTGEIKQFIKDVENKIDENISYIKKNSNYRTLPIKKLVQLQLGCILISMKYLE